MKTALITGASGGIGKAVAQLFIKNGYFTVCHYNSDDDSINTFKSRLKKDGLDGYAYFCKADFTVLDEVKLLYDKAIEQFGHIDVLINNAGVDLYKLIDETSLSDYDKVMDVNVKSAFFLSGMAQKEMIKRKCGSIIFVSSVWGQVGAAMETLYSTSKAAVIGLCKALAKEVAPSGIRVNAVCPGVVDTKMNDCFSADEKAQIISDIPLMRTCSAEEVANLIYYLCSDQARYITGQTITIDGGYTL